MLKTRVKRGAREMWHGMHSLFPPESQSLCESRADSIGFTGAKLITGSRTHLINILAANICETGIAQGVSADLYGRPLGTDRQTVGVGGADSNSHWPVLCRLNLLLSVPDASIGHSQRLQPFLRSSYSEVRKLCGWPPLHSWRWRQ
jgi:hypothetical protein